MSRRTSSDQFEPPAAARLRIDKWLWAARFFKTRALAQEAVEGGRVRIVNSGDDQNDLGERIKPSREVRLGDLLHIQIGDLVWRVSVRGLSDHRGPAPVARELYEESPESIAARQTQIEAGARKWNPAAASRDGRRKKIGV
jgi:ribosome-associated heat shock protein Hsp15